MEKLLEKPIIEPSTEVTSSNINRQIFTAKSDEAVHGGDSRKPGIANASPSQSGKSLERKDLQKIKQKEIVIVESEEEAQSSSSFSIDEQEEHDLDIQEERWNKAEESGATSSADAAKMLALRKKFRDLKHSKDKQLHELKKQQRSRLLIWKEKRKERTHEAFEGNVPPPLVSEKEHLEEEVEEVEIVGSLELCCGSGILTAELKKVGFHAVGVDWHGNKDSPPEKALMIDLTKENALPIIKQLVKDNNVKLVHIAPPCGTSTRAREIRIRKKWWNRNKKRCDPKPLRSDLHPEGLPGLEGINKIRVEKANKLYKFTAELVVFLEEIGVAWTVENPANSIMWLTRWFKKAFKDLEGKASRIEFDMCMNGGERPKATTFWNGSAMSVARQAKSAMANIRICLGP